MTTPRRTFLRLAAAAAALPILPRTAGAQSYPTRPVRIVVGYPPGGPTDIFARLMGQWLSDHMGQPFVIENRPGAGSTIGVQSVVNSPADGYTLILISTSAVISGHYYKSLNFNLTRDIVPVCGIALEPLVMVVNPQVAAKTVPEFIADAKQKPGKYVMASVGNGTTPHMAGALFMMMAGVKMAHVPYRGGGPALLDLLSGQVQVLFATAPGIADYVRSGKLRALGVTGTMRLKELPDVPSVSDFVPGYESSQWYGISAPRDTPAEIIEKLNGDINAALADPQMRAHLSDLSGTPLPGTPADFGKLIAEETEKWGRVIKFANIKPE